MIVIKCDICGEELDDCNVYTIASFLCEECLKIYNVFEHEFCKEKDKISEKYKKDFTDLKEKYKKEILKLRENN